MITSKDLGEMIEKLHAAHAVPKCFEVGKKAYREILKMSEFVRDERGDIIFGLPIYINEQLNDYEIWLRS